MKRFYLIKVQADFCSMFYISAKNFHRLLEVCNEKGFLVTVYSSLMLYQSPDVGGRHFKEVFNIVSKAE